MDSRRLGRVHLVAANRQTEKCIFGFGCTIAEGGEIGEFFPGDTAHHQTLVPMKRHKMRFDGH